MASRVLFVGTNIRNARISFTRWLHLNIPYFYLYPSSVFPPPNMTPAKFIEQYIQWMHLWALEQNALVLAF